MMPKLRWIVWDAITEAARTSAPYFLALVLIVTVLWLTAFFHLGPLQ